MVSMLRTLSRPMTPQTNFYCGFDLISATVCAHTLLAASTNGSESTVILDLKKDWRFKSSPNHEGFYASFPIMADASFGDKSAISYPIGESIDQLAMSIESSDSLFLRIC